MMRAGKNEEALQLLAQITRSAPEFGDAFETYGELLDIAGQQDLSASMHGTERELRLGARFAAPDRPYPQRRVGRFTQEVAAYSVAARHVIGRAFPFMALGNAFLMRGLPREAMLHYDAALAYRPREPEITALKADALVLMNRPEDAVPLYGIALASNSNNAGALSGRAIAYLALGEITKAHADWRRQLALLGPEQASARACVALRLGEYALAHQELDRAIEKDPKNPYWRLFRLTAMMRLGKSIDACDAPVLEEWPAPLIALYAGHATAEEILLQATPSERRTEALFHSAVIALSRDPDNAGRLLQQSIDGAPPSSIEYCIARHELARLTA
jgi:tetratricopeptide (TPR) repeat protein